MPETLDIQKVISTSTSSDTLDDLNKKGFKQVKVLNQAIITKLIGEAVDRVLTERSREISREERDKVIKEARSQFENLAKRRLEKERSRIDELDRQNQTLVTENETLKKRMSAAVEVQATRDQALARVNSLEGEVSKYKAEADRLQAELAMSNAESVGQQSDIARLGALESELESLRSQLAVKSEELVRVKSEGGGVEKILEALQSRLGAGAQPAEMSKIMLSLDGLSRRLSNISGSGGPVVSDEDAEITKDFALNSLFDTEKQGGIESNVSNVKVKENKAAGVKGALAKLKKLQQGDSDGG